MARKLLVVNLMLLASVAVLSQRLVSSWDGFAAEVPTPVRTEAKSTEVVPAVPLEQAEPLSQYLVIAERNLFSPNRTPQAAAGVEVEEKPPEMPVEPKLLSVFSVGDEREAILNVFKGRRGKQAEKQPVKVGDDVQGYAVSSIEDSYLVLSWKDQDLTIELSNDGAAKKAARPSQQAVNIITIGSAGALVETTGVSADIEEARGLQVAVAGTAGRSGQAGMGRAGAQGVGSSRGRSGQMGGMGGMGGMQSGRGTMGGMGGSSRLGGQSSFGGAGGMSGTRGGTSNMNRRPIR